MQTQVQTPNNLSILYDIYRMALRGGIYSLAQDLSQYNRLHILNKTESCSQGHIITNF
jgi:hypothetical protein